MILPLPRPLLTIQPASLHSLQCCVAPVVRLSHAALSIRCVCCRTVVSIFAAVGLGRCEWSCAAFVAWCTVQIVAACTMRHNVSVRACRPSSPRSPSIVVRRSFAQSISAVEAFHRVMTSIQSAATCGQLAYRCVVVSMAGWLHFAHVWCLAATRCPVVLPLTRIRYRTSWMCGGTHGCWASWKRRLTRVV